MIAGASVLLDTKMKCPHVVRLITLIAWFQTEGVWVWVHQLYGMNNTRRTIARKSNSTKIYKPFGANRANSEWDTGIQKLQNLVRNT